MLFLLSVFGGVATLAVFAQSVPVAPVNFTADVSLETSDVLLK